MSPEVIAAIIAGGVGIVTVIATVVVQIKSGAAARHRWPGVRAGLCLWRHAIAVYT